MLKLHFEKVTITHIILISLVLHAFVIPFPEDWLVFDESLFSWASRTLLEGEDRTPYQMPGLHGNAKEKISELESADVIFIGGTGGDTAEIVKLSENKLKSSGRIVIGIILIETLYSVLQILDKLKFDSIDITQVTISKSRKTTTGTMMLARNPVTIISATKI